MATNIWPTYPQDLSISVARHGDHASYGSGLCRALTAAVFNDRAHRRQRSFFVQRMFVCVSDVPAIADYPLDDKGTTYRKLILDKYPELDINFVHHAGNSSGVVDRSAAILLASPSYAKAHGLKPRVRVVAMANMGDSPTPMLNAPVPAACKVLAKAGLTLDDIDLFEINEAFAVVAEKFIRDSSSTARRSTSMAARSRSAIPSVQPARS
jgi:acetyl-CoA acetyltransferase